MTAQQLSGAMATTLAAAATAAAENSSANSNGVSALATPFSDPDMEAMRQKMNELLTALRR